MVSIQIVPKPGKNYRYESPEGRICEGLEQGEEHRGEKGNVETELPTKDVGNKAGRREITSHCTDVQDSDGPEGLPMCDGSYITMWRSGQVGWVCVCDG